MSTCRLYRLGEGRPQVVNRAIATGTRMEILATEHVPTRRLDRRCTLARTHANVQRPVKGLTCFIARLIREYGGGGGGPAIGKRAQ